MDFKRTFFRKPYTQRYHQCLRFGSHQFQIMQIILLIVILCGKFVQYLFLVRKTIESYVCTKLNTVINWLMSLT